METEAEACETESKQTQYRKEFSQADNSEVFPFMLTFVRVININVLVHNHSVVSNSL